MPIVTAVIPAYNEEIAIGSVVMGTKKYVNHVIVVDDGSIDNTAEIAKMAGAEVIKHPNNIGKGAALKTGFGNVKDADIILTLDGDGQHHPEDIPKLLKPIENGEADVVNGSRYLGKNNTRTPIYRRLGQTVLDKATNMDSGLDITDSQSGFRAFAKYTIPAFRFNQNGFFIESEMLIDAANFGSRIKEVEIGVTYDQENIHKKNPVSHGVSVLVGILQDMEFNRPLYYFTIPGLILISIGLILGLKFFGDYLAGGSGSLLPTAMAGLVGLGGIFIALTGVILHSISRMIQQFINK
jgi:glycosyltransferase involved in cell wall biosynthesis